MKKQFKKVAMILSTGLLCAGGVQFPAHAQVATSDVDSSPRSAQVTNRKAAAEDAVLEEVVVTGSSIRGAPPVGSNVISVDRETIEKTGVQTAQQLLKLMPAIAGMGTAGQGSAGTFDNAKGNAPSIHGLGGVSSNSTLVLIDGHRVPLGGIRRNFANSSILPSNALERVEVLPEGASSVYGSDAVAGVINFITRKRFNGLEFTGQGGFGDQYHTYSGNLLAGKTWDNGSAQVIYSYSQLGALRQADRPFTFADQRAFGGSNFASFACGPATIQPLNTTSIYTYPYTAAPVSNAQVNAPCDSARYNDLLPADMRHSVMLKIEQELSDNLTAGMDVVYSSDRNVMSVPRGSVTARVFGPGSANPAQINPFFEAPAGVTTNTETVRFDASELLGSGAQQLAGADTFYAFGRLEYRAGSNWLITASTMLGADRSFADTLGTLCTSCASLALNGTVNQTGSLTTPPVIGTGISVSNVPLTLANALDPFRPRATNRTSPEVLALLTDSAIAESTKQTTEQYTLKADGTLFALPGGNLKVAGGFEYLQYAGHPRLTSSLNLGPSSIASRLQSYNYSRDVKSVFAEVFVPIVGPAMAVPLVRSLQLAISGRRDDYSDFGSTTNPRFAVNWQIIDSVKVRGNIARSFVAPVPSNVAVGDKGAYQQATFPQFEVPLASFPQARLIPACATAVTTCTFSTAAIPGIIINGANPGLQPETGRSWSVGMDVLPSFLPDMAIRATFWHYNFDGGITAPQPSLAINAPGFAASLLTIYPNSATPAEVAAFAGGRPLGSILPSPIYFSYDFRNQNALYLTVEGIDADIRYSPNFEWGSISTGVAVTYKTRFDQQVGEGSPVFSVLNTTGFNSTFPSEKLDLRADFGVQIARFGATAYINYTGAYIDWSSSAVNPVMVNPTTKLPVGGGDHIDAYATVDAHLSYDFGTALAGTQVFLDVTNLFDKDPPFLNRNNIALGQGYDNYLASPIGRVVTAGFRIKF